MEALGNKGHLVTRVLQMWAPGHISAPAVQYITEGAVMDGVTDPSALALSKIGSQGRWLQNCQRDIARNFFTDVELPPPTLSKSQPRTLGTQQGMPSWPPATCSCPTSSSATSAPAAQSCCMQLPMGVTCKAFGPRPWNLVTHTSWDIHCWM